MTEANREVQVGNVTFSNDAAFGLIAGPCALESRDHALECAAAIKEISERVGIATVYKSSFDKANRTSLAGGRGIGLTDALPIFAEVKERFGLPVVTDVHAADQCAPVGRSRSRHSPDPGFPVPANRSSGGSGANRARSVNVKKGQFLAPWDMKNVLAKVTGSGNPNVYCLTERGASFGYNTLVSDMRALPIMAQTGAPVVFDATHSVQQPGGQGGSTGGDRTMVPVLSRAAVAAGVAGLFIETHPDPDKRSVGRTEHGSAEGP